MNKLLFSFKNKIIYINYFFLEAKPVLLYLKKQQVLHQKNQRKHYFGDQEVLIHQKTLTGRKIDKKFLRNTILLLKKPTGRMQVITK